MMSSSRKRYRFVLVEEPENRLPMRYRRMRRHEPPRSQLLPPDSMAALVEAFSLLQHRGQGFEAWAPVLSDNPIAFLLDAVDDAVLLREADGRIIYRNRAARRLPQPQRAHGAAVDHIECDDCRRREMPFTWRNVQLVLEVIQYVG